MIIAGVVLFIFIGIVISLLGGGGSILTVPVFVYIFDVDPLTATSYSMFLVGVSNWVAAIDSMRKQLVLFKQAVYFAIPALLVTYPIRRFVLPNVPEVLLTTPHFVLSRGTSIMILFAVIMLIASIKSIRGKNAPGDGLPSTYNFKVIAVQGLLVGLVTGFVGAGGGFLIIPALVFTNRIPMKNAVATSLLIIAVTTSFGFLGDFNPAIHIKWEFLLSYTAVSVLGVFAANQFKDKLSNTFLRKSFGYLILVLSFFIFITQERNLNLDVHFSGITMMLRAVGL